MALTLAVGFATLSTFVPANAETKLDRKDGNIQQLQNEVSGLLDREQIRDLPIIYCHFVRAKDIKAIVNLFTSDGELVLPDSLGSGAKGPEALLKFYEKSISSADPWP